LTQTKQELLRVRGRSVFSLDMTSTVGIDGIETGLAAECSSAGTETTRSQLVITNAPVCANPVRGIVIGELLTIAPNPGGGEFMVRSDFGIDEIEVLNVIGEREIPPLPLPKESEIVVRIETSGVYVVRARIGGEWVSRQVVVVR
ncbi:MAG: T9SS type A sorting domain-containing protein, partial [Candidatus Kapabacteria bacterium]|nr:T9SS type A sorting domain-containing protein [Candidatus Kapabacteria bacterium]